MGAGRPMLGDRESRFHSWHDNLGTVNMDRLEAMEARGVAAVEGVKGLLDAADSFESRIACLEKKLEALCRGETATESGSSGSTTGGVGGRSTGKRTAGRKSKTSS